MSQGQASRWAGEQTGDAPAVACNRLDTYAVQLKGSYLSSEGSCGQRQAAAIHFEFNELGKDTLTSETSQLHPNQSTFSAWVEIKSLQQQLAGLCSRKLID